jgi:hypothetical protein
VGVVGFVYPEWFKKNTEYILFLRSIFLGGEGCWERMVADPVYLILTCILCLLKA